MPLSLLFYAAFLLGMALAPVFPQAGSVSGRVEVASLPPQQAATRYPAPGGQVQKSIDALATVAYIDGRIAGAPAWPRPERTTIHQKDLQFSPSLLVIPTGTSISFPNQDSELHNVFSYSKSKRFDLGRYPRGESKSVTFDKPGIVKIYCEIHPWMRAAVLVLENPFYGIVAADGTFSITGIPAGHYDLVVWNIDSGSKKVEVDVAAGKAPEILIRLTGRNESGVPEQTLPVNAMPAGASHPVGHLPLGACCAGIR